jgi:hypothetical protein
VEIRRSYQRTPAAKRETVNKEFCRHGDGQKQTTIKKNMKRTLLTVATLALLAGAPALGCAGLMMIPARAIDVMSI